MSRSSALVCVSCLGVIACNSASGQPGAAAQAAPVAARVAPQASPQVAAADAPKPVDKNDYVPAEFKNGQARWKDTGVYLDGKPIGFLNFGELPITLKPTWIKDKVSADKRYGTNDPGWRWAQQRFYKFNDYLRALGIAPGSVRAIHVLGPKMTDSIVATGRDLTSAKGDAFMFRFGGDVTGKAIPQVPEHFGNGRSPDKISAVMIYLKKQPPTLVPDEGFMLDGQVVVGVPYYGEPLRGGVRVYLDDKLATIIKRQDLDLKTAAVDADGNQHWSLYDFLHARGVDTSHIVEGWAIRGDLRKEKFAAADLATIMFTATAQAKGVVTLGDKHVAAQVIALHTREIKPEEIPVPTEDEQ